MLVGQVRAAQVVQRLVRHARLDVVVNDRQPAAALDDDARRSMCPSGPPLVHKPVASRRFERLERAAAVDVQFAFELGLASGVGSTIWVGDGRVP